MATILGKDLTRESSILVDGKEILITLTSSQDIELKLKGQRGNGKSISILSLYEQLHGISGDVISDDVISGSVSIKSGDLVESDRRMVSLFDLRSHNAISTLDLVTISKFDQIIKSVLDSYES